MVWFKSDLLEGEGGRENPVCFRLKYVQYYFNEVGHNIRLGVLGNVVDVIGVFGGFMFGYFLVKQVFGNNQSFYPT